MTITPHPLLQCFTITETHFPHHYNYLDLGVLLLVNKKIHEIALAIFAKKAACENLPFRTLLEGIKHFESISWDAILELLKNPRSYTDPDRIALPLLGACKSWQEAEPDQRAFNYPQQTAEPKALSLAVYYQRTQLVKLFLDKLLPPVYFSELEACPHPDRENVRLPSPLHISILMGDEETFKVQIEKEVHLMEIDYNLNFRLYGFDQVSTPIGFYECALGGRKARQLMDQAALNLPMVHFLLKAGSKALSGDLVAAAEVCSMEAMSLFIKRGSPLDPETATEALVSLLEIIPAHLDPSAKEMIEFLIYNKADVNDRRVHELYAPLHLAVLSGCLELVKLLLSKGAKPVEEDDEESPLAIAQEKGFTEIAQILEEHSASC